MTEAVRVETGQPRGADGGEHLLLHMGVIPRLHLLGRLEDPDGMRLPPPARRQRGDYLPAQVYRAMTTRLGWSEATDTPTVADGRAPFLEIDVGPPQTEPFARPQAGTREQEEIVILPRTDHG